MESTRARRRSSALVLSGAVAKGAFEAGVVSGLGARGLSFDRLVGTSAGALNTAVLAAGAAVGGFRPAAERLEELWRHKGGIGAFIALTLNLGLGISSTARVEALLVEELDAIMGSAPRREVRRTHLTLVTTDLTGRLSEGELTHEHAYSFSEQDLLDPGGRRRIARVAATSAAFPLLFIPPWLDGRQHVDGGLVNNTPLLYALDEEAKSNAIVVVSAEANIPAKLRTLRWWPVPTLPIRLVETVINERIGRDLIVARKRNRKRQELIEALAGTDIDAAALADSLGMRKLDLVTIRPDAALEGGSFRGFFSRRLRDDYIEKGRRAAVAARLPLTLQRVPASAEGRRPRGARGGRRRAAGRSGA